MKNTDFLDLLKSWIVIALGVIIAAHIVDGISYDSSWTLFIVVFLLSVFNAFLKPVLVILTLPLIILTFGIGLWFINALLFILVSKLVSGFEVASFPSALWGALIVSLVSMITNLLLGGRRRNDPPGPGENINKDDVIDI